jgi:hypothetical protein
MSSARCLGPSVLSDGRDGSDRMGSAWWCFDALQDVRAALPFPLLGLYSDNGGEFINNQLSPRAPRRRSPSPALGPTARTTTASWRRRTGGTVALVAWASVGETGAMRSHRHPHPCPAPPSAFAQYRFPPEVITLAVRWYLRFGLSYRLFIVCAMNPACSNALRSRFAPGSSGSGGGQGGLPETESTTH